MSDLAVINVSKSFPGVGETVDILRGVNLELSCGQALVITGPSGCGKSTLLYILGVMEPPLGGQVLLKGQDPYKLHASEQALFRNVHIGFIFQDHHLLPQCTVLENVLLPSLAGRGIRHESSRRARSLLRRVGLERRTRHRPSQLSGGERQRVAVCRALLQRPWLLLADEPTGNLDPETAESVGNLLLEISREENAILITVTHSMELANRFPLHMELHKGQLIDPMTKTALAKRT